MAKTKLMEATGTISIIVSGSLATYIAGAKGLAVALMGVVGVLLVFVGVMQEVEK